MHTGKIARFNLDKGFGFIAPDDGGNWNFPTAFLIASMLARIQFQAPAFPNCGSITGPRILLQRHSVFDGGSVTVPGNSAGTVDATSTAY